MNTTLLLVRHGQSTWNAQGRWQGQADPPLSELGRKQAKMAAKRLGEIHVVVSSPQIRALETASILAESAGIDEVFTHDGLVERVAGEWSGLTKDEIEEQYPGYLKDGKRPPSYEGDDSLLTRVVDALTDTAQTYPGTEVLVACHGGVIKTFVESIGDQKVRVPNLSGWSVSYNESGFSLIEPLVLLPDDMSTGGQHMRV